MSLLYRTLLFRSLCPADLRLSFRDAEGFPFVPFQHLGDVNDLADVGRDVDQVAFHRFDYGVALPADINFFQQIVFNKAVQSPK